MIHSTKLYLWRNKGRTLLFLMVLGVIFLGEMIGLLLSTVSAQAREDAFAYNGAALYMESGSLKLTFADYDRIRELDHVLGIGNWKEIVVNPLDTKNVKDHIGQTPDIDVRGLADAMVIIAYMDTPMYQLFRWEKAVSLVKGTFPERGSNGVLIEQRYAQANELDVGDEVNYGAREEDKEMTLRVCGIYEVDSEFEILDDNTEGASVYIHSPYNTMFMDYEYALQLLEFDNIAETGGEIFTDDVRYTKQVADELYQLFGDRIRIYDRTTTYLEKECRVVGLMEKTSSLISYAVLAIGGILLLIIFSLYSEQYKRETGLYLVLGESRARCMARYALVTACYVLGGLLIGILLYQIGGDYICSRIYDSSAEVIRKSMNIAGGGYSVSGLAIRFEIRVNATMFYTVQNLLSLLGIAAISWLITLLLPLHSVFTARPRTLLNCKH